MAEVGQRLVSGVCRFSVLTNSLGRPLSTGESPRKEDASTRGRLELQPVAKGAAERRISAILPQGNVRLRCASSSELDPSLGRLQQGLLPGRAPAWSRGAGRDLDTSRSPRQLRSFCTVVVVLVQPGSDRPGLRKRMLAVHPAGDSSSRSYSWRSDSRSKDAPPPRRNGTAYYDVLQVSPVATPSQIKTAYYKLSFIHHPDKNPGNDRAVHRFFEISEAYAVLANANLRRKYDRGILSHSDIQNAGRPSSKETTSRSKGSSQHQHRARQFSQAAGRTMFDFDAFYQAHYGEQLKRERDMKARRQRMVEQQQEDLRRWQRGRMVEVTVLMVLATAGCVLFSLGLK
ncbi:dnaJ (Hsp40) homolog, subfamily C, member 30b [Brachionichthys hirsutus]|uniref:dnaJ (Hsp40) homolog, subfamily C, member 30b n=1 Tax=Brachionichthys hirsutus TaxID=412623 RepID=UPI0036053231